MSSESPETIDKDRGGDVSKSESKGPNEIPASDNPGLPFLVGGIPLHGVNQPPVPIHYNENANKQ